MDSSGSRYSLRSSARSVSYKEKPEDEDEFSDDVDDDMVAESPETPGTPTPAPKSGGKVADLVDSPVPGADNDTAKTGTRTTPEPNSSSKPVKRMLFPDAPSSGPRMRDWVDAAKQPPGGVAGVAGARIPPSGRFTPYDAAKRPSLGSGGSASKRSKASTPSKMSNRSKASTPSKVSKAGASKSGASKSSNALKLWEMPKPRAPSFNPPNPLNPRPYPTVPSNAAHPAGFPQPLSTIPGHPAPSPFMPASSGLGAAHVGWNPMMPTFPGVSGMPPQPVWDPTANLGPLPSSANFGLYSNLVSPNNNFGPLPSTNNFGSLPSTNNLGPLPSANIGLQGQGRFGLPNRNGGSYNQNLSQGYPNFGLPNNNSNTNNDVGYGSSAPGTSLVGNMFPTPCPDPFLNPYVVPRQNQSRFLPTVPPVPSSPYVRSSKFDRTNPYAAFLRAQAGAGLFPGTAVNNNGTMPYGQMGSTFGSTVGITALAQLPNFPPTPAPALTGAAAVASTRLLAAGPPTPADNNLTSTNNQTVQYRPAVSSALNNNPVVQQPPIVPGLPTVSSHTEDIPVSIDPRWLGVSSPSFNNSNNSTSVASELPPVSSSFFNTPSATVTGTQRASSSSIDLASSPFAAEPEFTFPNPAVNLALASSTFLYDNPFSSVVKSESQDEKLFKFISEELYQHSPSEKPFKQSPSERPPASFEQPAIPTASKAQVPTTPGAQDDNMGMPIRTYPRPAHEVEASSSNSRANGPANSNSGANANNDIASYSAANNETASDPHSEVYDLLRELRVRAHSEGENNQAARFEDIAANGHPAQHDPAGEYAMMDALSTIAHMDLTSDLDSDATQLASVAGQRAANSSADSGNSESDKENSAAGSDETGEQANGGDEGDDGSSESSSSSDDDAAAAIPHQPRTSAAASPMAGYWLPQPELSRRALPFSSADRAFETDGSMPFAPWRVRHLVPFRPETSNRVVTAPARYLVALGHLYPDAVFAVARVPASANTTVRIVGRHLGASVALHFPGTVNNLPPREGGEEDLGALYIIQLVQRDWPIGGVGLLPDTAHARRFVEEVQGAFDLLPAGREAFYFLPVTAPVGPGGGRTERARGVLVCRAYEGCQGPQQDRIVVEWMVMNGGGVDQYERGREVLVFMGEAAVEADRWPRRRVRAVRGPGGGRADAARDWPAASE